jgi:hypothetical protein
VTFEEYDAPGFKTVNSIVTAGGAKAAWFKDSEGNILAVVQNPDLIRAVSSFKTASAQACTVRADVRTETSKAVQCCFRTSTP